MVNIEKCIANNPSPKSEWINITKMETSQTVYFSSNPPFVAGGL